MGSLISHVLPLALGAAVSPTIMTLSVLVLSGPHGKARQAVFTAVNVGLMSVIAIVGGSVLAHAATRHRSGKVHTASAVIDITLGVVLLLLLAREHWAPAQDTEKTQAAKAAVEPGVAPLRYVGLGIALTISNFTTLALFLPALKEIGISRQPRINELIAGAMLVIIATVTSWGPLLLSVIAPRPAESILSAINRFTTTYKQQIVQVVLLVFGVYLLVKGLTA